MLERLAHAPCALSPIPTEEDHTMLHPPRAHFPPSSHHSHHHSHVVRFNGSSDTAGPGIIFSTRFALSGMQ